MTRGLVEVVVVVDVVDVLVDVAVTVVVLGIPKTPLSAGIKAASCEK
jgi:hypothetical protein